MDLEEKLLPCITPIVRGYLGVLIFRVDGSHYTLKGEWKNPSDYKNQHSLSCILAFDKWEIAGYKGCGAFEFCYSLTHILGVPPKLPRDMSWMFYQASFFQGDLSQWDTSQVRDMHGMFRGASCFCGDLSKWDIGKVMDMSSMFQGCPYRPFWYTNPSQYLCSGCLKIGRFKRCGRCLNDSYCSERCQKSDWARHKIVCRQIRSPPTSY